MLNRDLYRYANMVDRFLEKNRLKKDSPANSAICIFKQEVGTRVQKNIVRENVSQVVHITLFPEKYQENV